jgi:hypothetical protein
MAGLDGCGNSRPHRDSIPGLSSPQRVAIPAHVVVTMQYKCLTVKINISFENMVKKELERKGNK